MIIRCELKIRPESVKRIEAKLCSISEDEDVLIFNIINKMTGKIKKDLLHAEHEALKLFLESVKDELNGKFSLFSASVDYSARLPQLRVRENGKI